MALPTPGTARRPSSAESTEIAGVIIASPKNSAHDSMPSNSTGQVRFFSTFSTSAISEIDPPSPSLSIRIRMKTYLIVTIRISAHRISDTMPMISAGEVPTPSVFSDALNA